jgi:hypothetical protein
VEQNPLLGVSEYVRQFLLFNLHFRNDDSGLVGG